MEEVCVVDWEGVEGVRGVEGVEAVVGRLGGIVSGGLNRWAGED